MPKAAAADAASPQPAPDSASAAADQVASPPADAAPETPAEAAPPAEPTVTGRWEYISDEPLIYTNVPVTPVRGDVVEWAGNPVVQPDGSEVIAPGPPAADGRWQATDAEVTRWPDNHPKTIAAAQEAKATAQPTDAPKEG